MRHIDCEKCELYRDALGDIEDGLLNLEPTEELIQLMLARARRAFEEADALDDRGTPEYMRCADCGRQVKYASQGLCAGCLAIGREEWHRD